MAKKLDQRRRSVKAGGSDEQKRLWAILTAIAGRVGCRAVAQHTPSAALRFARAPQSQTGRQSKFWLLSAATTFKDLADFFVSAAHFVQSTSLWRESAKALTSFFAPGQTGATGLRVFVAFIAAACALTSVNNKNKLARARCRNRLATTEGPNVVI